MSAELQLRLPNWPPRRLVIEALTAWGLRHLDEEIIDYRSAPWPVIRGVVIAFLRHQLTDYDDCLRARCEHDPAFRDQLAQQVERAAYRQYPWFATDPRPFPEVSEDGLFFDLVARQLADLSCVRNHMLSAAQDLRRAGGSPDQIASLRRKAADIRATIQGMYTFFSRPKMGSDAEGEYTHPIILPRYGAKRYDFFGARPLSPSHIQYIGIKCPQCEVSVARRKQLIDLGQGFHRVAVFSCFCLTYAVYLPAHYRLHVLTLEDWTRIVQEEPAAEMVATSALRTRKDAASQSPP
jgi:hypothetical protein